MEWSEAREMIQKNITEGMDINTKRSSFRKVIAVQKKGFVVQIGKANQIMVALSMLEKCFPSLKDDGGYNGKVFRSNYKEEAELHSCYVHVVGMIFKKAGIATSNAEESSYYFKK
ncbi:MAG: hypothetical protein NTV78_01070 [Caldiserica bacterium]|nr:hypothetical protein [Caldisericota bacterium]